MPAGDLHSLLKYMQETYLKLWYNHTLPISRSKAVSDSDDFRLNEKMIQMLWNKNHYLNEILFDDQQKSYKITDPGTWNREPGPDFKNARFLSGKNSVIGDVEIHLKPENWNSHGHQFNPDYENVKLHVVWENPSKTRSPSHIPVIELCSQLAVAEDRVWELRDSTIYSKSQIHPPAECAEQMNKITDPVLQRTFRAAGLGRLQRKSNHIKLLATKHGFRQTIYSQLADAMGYKANRIQFKEVCQRAKLESLNGYNNIEKSAYLWGSSSLLPDHTQVKVHEEILENTKNLWNIWWKLRSTSLDQIEWNRASSRPANSPERRLAAFICILEKNNFHPEDIVSQSCKILLAGNSPKKFLEERLTAEGEWEHFCNFKTKMPKPMKLVGNNRKLDIMINVIIPAMAVLLSESGKSNDIHKLYMFYCSLPKSQDNHVLDIAKYRFFIPPSRMKDIVKKAVDQQGIMQLMHDFQLPQTPSDIKDFWEELGINLEISK